MWEWLAYKYWMKATKVGESTQTAQRGKEGPRRETCWETFKGTSRRGWAKESEKSITEEIKGEFLRGQK